MGRNGIKMRGAEVYLSAPLIIYIGITYRYCKPLTSVQRPSLPTSTGENDTYQNGVE